MFNVRNILVCGTQVYKPKNTILTVTPRFWNDRTIKITKHNIPDIDISKFKHSEDRVKLKNYKYLDIMQCFMENSCTKSKTHYFPKASSMLLNI